MRLTEEIITLAEQVCQLQTERDETLHYWTGTERYKQAGGRFEALRRCDGRLQQAIWAMGRALGSL